METTATAPTICIVNDNPSQRALYRAFLKKEYPEPGQIVEVDAEAQAPETILNEIAKFRGRQPLVILMDHKMQKTSGPELIPLVRELISDCIIIGTSTAGETESFHEAGADAVLPHNGERGDLLALIAEQLQLKRSAIAHVVPGVVKLDEQNEE